MSGASAPVGRPLRTVKPGAKLRTPCDSLVLSETGPVRRINADCVKMDNRLGFYALADGVGSTPASAEASCFAVEEAHRCFKEMLAAQGGGRCDLPELIHEVGRRFRQRFAGPSVPATTLSVVSVRNHVIDYATVGDSPVLLIFDGEAFLLTRDHTIADRGCVYGSYTEIKSLGGSNVLFTSIGRYAPQPVAYEPICTVPGARLLICSDGLFEVVSQEELGEIARSTSSIGGFRQELRRRAAAIEPRDNYSAILIELPATEDAR